MASLFVRFKALLQNSEARGGSRLLSVTGDAERAEKAGALGLNLTLSPPQGAEKARIKCRITA